MNKFCKFGNHNVSINNFHKSKRSSDGLQHCCKDCSSKRHKLWKINNPEKYKANTDRKLRKEKAERAKICVGCNSSTEKGTRQCRDGLSRCLSCKQFMWRKNRAPKKRIEDKLYRESHKEEMKQYKKVWEQENKENRCKKQKTKRETDISFRLTQNLRSRVRRAIEINQKAGSAVKDLGCTVDELKIHLENQFRKEMSWDNYGKKGWHIDHILPLSKFDLTDREQFLKACHYTNLQPLWYDENIRKSNKVA